MEPSSRSTPVPPVLRTPPKGPLGQEATTRNEDVPGGVSLLRHSHIDGVPKMSDIHLGACTPSSTPRQWRLAPTTPPDIALFIPPPYALHMCLHLPAGVQYYQACSLADTWPPDTSSVVGAVHYVQVSGSHQIQFCPSLILPEHHHVVLLPSLHNLVSLTATGLTRASLLLLAAAYQPQHLRKWVRGLPRAPPDPVARWLRQQPTIYHPATCDTPLPDHSQSPLDIFTPNVQRSLRPLRALDVLLREYQYPLTRHVQESGPLVLRTVHPLYHTI